MGTFELGKLNGAQTIAIENSMGNVGLTVDGGADEYSIDIQSDMGDTAFNGQTYPGGYLREKENARSLTVRTAMGNVAVTTETHSLRGKSGQSHTPCPFSCSKSTTFFLAVQERFSQKPLYFVRGCGTICLIHKNNEKQEVRRVYYGILFFRTVPYFW